MFEIFGVTFHWYGLIIGLGVSLTMSIALINRRNIKRKVLEKAMWWTILGGVIGARLYHVVDYWGRYYSTNLVKTFYFWEGGLGIWGAIGGGVAAILIFSYFNKLKFLNISDTVVVGVPLAQAIGRVGNYLNGELFGKNGEPLFIYEGALNLVLFGVLWKISRKQSGLGIVSGVYLVGYGAIRVALENFRPDETIWKFYGVPVAVIFGVAAIVIGSYFIFRKRRS